MGLLDRSIDALNRVARPFQNASTPTDPRLKRGARVAERGTTATATIVGIRRTYRQDATHTTYALRVEGSPVGGVARFGTEVTTTPHLHRLRLGLRVPVRIDGDRAVIDWSSLAATWGLTDPAPGQRPQGDPPDDGIDERSLTTRQRKLLERGRRATATITGLQRAFVLGMPTLNWTVHLRHDDGTPATVKDDEVPPYAWWIARPGAEVPVAVDATDPRAVVVDWARASVEAAASGPVDLGDRPPDGSIAAEVTAAAPAPTTALGTMPSDPVATIAATRDEAVVTGTLRDWVGEVEAGRMKPKAFLKYVADWERSGMCTPAEAAAARAAAGVRE